MNRGVVYLDGLGDIVDVQTPLSKLSFKETLQSTYLSTYLIVVTTFERCAMDFRKIGRSRDHLGGSARESLVINGPNASQLLKLRWLRLIVDEGHELGKSTGPSLNEWDGRDPTVCLQKFVSSIAAERRYKLCVIYEFECHLR